MVSIRSSSCLGHANDFKQVVNIEGFCKTLFRAGCQQFLLVLCRQVAAHGEDPDVSVIWNFLDASAHFCTFETRQHEVEEYNIRAKGVYLLARFETVEGSLDFATAAVIIE